MGKRGPKAKGEAKPFIVANEFAEIGEDELPDDVMNVMDELGADVAKVVLYRRLPGEKQAYISTIGADEFDLDFVARMWGGGRYLARLTKVGGGFVRGITFYIDESIKPDKKKPDGDGAAPSGSGVTDHLLERVIDKLGERAPQKDPMEIAAALASAAATQAQTTMAAMTAAMAPLLAKITELSSGRKDTPIGDLVQAIQLGADLGGHDEGYMGVVKEVGVPLIRALEQALANQRGGKRVALPPPPKPEGQPVAEPMKGPSEPGWVTAFRPFVPKLVDFAVHAGETSAIAAIIDAQYPRLARWLEDSVANPAFEAEVLKHFPDLAAHQAWVHELLDEFVVEDEDDPEAKPEVGKQEIDDDGE